MCVVESTRGVPLIVCEHRLLSTDMQSSTSYQRSRLLEIAKAVFEEEIEPQNIEYKYEVTTKLRQRADFVLMNTPPAYSSSVASGTDKSEILIFEGATWQPLFSPPIP